MRPSWANTLVVPAGLETNLKPWLFWADQVMVALVMISSPEVPGVLVTRPLLVTGPFHWMSKLHVASTELGTRKRKSAFGMLKKSCSARSFALIRAVPVPSSTGRTGNAGTVQKSPLG